MANTQTAIFNIHAKMKYGGQQKGKKVFFGRHLLLLNLRPLDFYVSNGPCPKFHQRAKPTYFSRRYV